MPPLLDCEPFDACLPGGATCTILAPTYLAPICAAPTYEAPNALIPANPMPACGMTDTKLCLTAITSIIWSTTICIAPVAVIATTTAACTFLRTDG